MRKAPPRSTSLRQIFGRQNWCSETSPLACVICSELNGTNFYFQPRDRVLNLQDYRRALDSFVMQGAYNPETKRPWNKEDAEARWAQMQKQATTDQANCAAVASLPSLRLKLKELQQQQSTPADAASK